MNGKENIINKILSDADNKCHNILSVAESQAQQIVESSMQAIARERVELDARIETISAERMRNRNATAELEAKKYKLNAKQQLISGCYNKAYEQLLRLSGKERLAFIGTLIEKFAEVGETVYVTQADSHLVTQLYLDGFDKKLTLANHYIRADGGIVLEGEGYEKDLTLGSVINYVREQTEGKVAEHLLGARNE